MQAIQLSFIVCVAASLILTPVVRKWAMKVGLYDIPKDERRVHKMPIPVSGGLAIFFAVVAGVLLFLPLDRANIAYLIGAAVVAFTGLYDDKFDMSPKAKFLFQILAGLILVLGGVRIEFFTNPFYGEDLLINLDFLAIPITVFWVVGITNTINLIDGLDGLACGISGIASISLMFVAYRFDQKEMAVLAAILAGSCLGFLPYNFNPAKIFMGDTGALFLGFTLSYLSIQGVMKSIALITIFIPVLILGVPVFDTTFAMIRRKLSGKSIAEADRGHLHHRLLNRGLNQKQTVGSLYGISILFGIVGNLVSNMHEKNGLITAIIIIALVGILALFLGLLHERGEEN
ncbi:Phospho-N-acetylmuramoyl-pentapeptide-transferase [Aedoeadaptatus ivorii]|uniref:Phospho-N-acetylmuramoyl-pentapeptide-transferase n=1 Tax=Aedoeadaptatus ivorii TaxID=54006 RepID=A0A448V0H3_9FIRM|nr:MraY family glycosyltransferase [Peptoniphilus ivorii]MDQ0507961.1 UDP-GlcNAc:undecaprenyl-phosphate GlcNAc-1-phosphate transferase [Peptoniphilus ivorii]VEJ34783.1 Phospho-N-acetylmuramoyl-pentapeptide-transferase [Peptoniphilus ivorii]